MTCWNVMRSLSSGLATISSSLPAAADLKASNSMLGGLHPTRRCDWGGCFYDRRRPWERQCRERGAIAGCCATLRVCCSGSGGDGGGGQPARRITDTSRIGLKSQLKLVKLKKELSSAPKERAVVRTKHRKKKLTVEEREVQRVEVARAEAEAKKMGAVSFRSLFGSDGLANPPVLLVDGYNVIFEARKSTRKAGTKLDGDLMDQYRRDLALNLDCFSHARGVKVMLVFDALNGAARRSTVTETSKSGLDVVWSGEMDADTYISCKVSELYGEGVPYVFVASNDATLQTTSRANRAYIVSGRRLIREMREVDKMAQEALREAKYDTLRRGVGQLRNNLPSGTFAKLEEMRQAGRRPYKHASEDGDDDSGTPIDDYLRSLRAKQSRPR